MRKMMTRLLLLTGALLLATSAAAQSSGEYRKGSFEIHVGGALPAGDLENVFRNAPVVGGNIGYRFLRYVQVEGGLDVGFGAARVNNTVQLSGGGTRGTRDREYFLSFGGRGVVPLQNERLLLSFGGGVAILNYNEVPIALANEVITCTNCGKREGVGSYLLFGIKGMVNPRFGIGMTVKEFRARTEGDRLDTRLPFESRDRWLNVAATFSVHW